MNKTKVIWKIIKGVFAGQPMVFYLERKGVGTSMCRNASRKTVALAVSSLIDFLVRGQKIKSGDIVEIIGNEHLSPERKSRIGTRAVVTKVIYGYFCILDNDNHDTEVTDVWSEADLKVVGNIRTNKKQ